MTLFPGCIYSIFYRFRQNFTNILKALYSSPEARVRLQGCYSEPFLISKCTRQGCPLSPLIFAIAKETLAISIRSHPDIHGVYCGPHIHKYAIFGDDVLLFITSPLPSLPNVCRLLDNFGNISGLHVNMTKSQALNINVPDSLVSRLKSNFIFSCNDSTIPYLGVHLPSTIDQIYATNYLPIFKKLELDLRDWSRLNLSLVGSTILK